MRHIPKLPLFLLAGLLLVTAGRPACAEVVHLRTGETIKGRAVRERSDDKNLVIEDYLSGATRVLEWEALDSGDAQRIKTDWGWIGATLEPIMVDRLEQKLSTGTQIVRGLIVREDDKNYYVMVGGREIAVLKATILDRSREAADPRDIYTPEQLVQKYHDKLQQEQGDAFDESDPRTAWKIADYAENAGDYDAAKKYFEICANDPDYLNAGVAKQRLTRVEEILRNKAALDDLREIHYVLSLKSFRRVRELLGKFTEAHPDLGDVLSGKLDKLHKDFEATRNAYFAKEAKFDFPKIVLRLIKEKVREKGIALSDATAWAKKELADLAFKELVARFQGQDDVTVAEAQGFWANRPKGNWRTVSYGSGTFIVSPAKIKPPKRRNPARNQKRKNQGPAPKLVAPKPPTRDQWWEQKADPKERQSWLMAYFVENSGLFEVSDEPKLVPCVTCNGTGLETQRLQTGGTWSWICRRCAGCQYDKRVRYR
jgi:tetratricopeptide (TPR) repeat protein